MEKLARRRRILATASLLVILCLHIESMLALLSHNSCIVDAYLIGSADNSIDYPSVFGSFYTPPEHPWPGVPSNTPGHPLVKVGNNFVDGARDFFLEHLEEFMEVYENRPDKVNICGIRIPHAFALWMAVKQLQPEAIIESGVNAGQSTYFIRNASSTAWIYAIDPLNKPICGQGSRWKDPTKRNTYFTGKKFKDFQEVDWIKEMTERSWNPEQALVFLDDHQRAFDRFSTFLRVGFRHIMLEDNYKLGEGATKSDKVGYTTKQMLAKNVTRNTQYLFDQLVSYSEFPMIVPPAMAAAYNGGRKEAGGFMVANDSNTDVMPPILRPDLDKKDKAVYQRMCQRLSIDPALKDEDSYMQFMSYNQMCYMELKVVSHYLRKHWK